MAYKMVVINDLLSGMILQVVGREDPWDGGSLNLDFMILFLWVDYFYGWYDTMGWTSPIYCIKPAFGRILRKKQLKQS